jgi:ArsR family transcriptional regulator, arsenate/arsenite/antimonite-responsive transcriptional repressor
MSTCCTPLQTPRVKHAATLVSLYQALADQTRLRILAILADLPDGPGGELCVCHIHASLGVSQPTASRHLAYLRKSGLVEARRDGVWMHYRLVRPDDPVVASVFDAALHALGHVDSTSRDRARAARAAQTAPPPA